MREGQYTWRQSQVRTCLYVCIPACGINTRVFNDTLQPSSTSSSPTLSSDAAGKVFLPAQELPYDTLVLALGSKTNDFGTPGAAENSIKLDSPQAAYEFHERLLEAILRDQNKWSIDSGDGGDGAAAAAAAAASTDGGSRKRSSGLCVAIVGGGATGVELAAELHTMAKVFGTYGFDHIDPEKDLSLVVVEAAPRLLPPLPEQLSAACLKTLRSMNIDVKLNARVTKVTEDSLELASGEVISSSLVVWAAGIKAAKFLKTLGGGTDTESPLETNKINQLLVDGNLRTTTDAHIYAFGDCAGCLQPDGSVVPARAQAAYQQAMYLADALPTLTKNSVSTATSGSDSSAGRAAPVPVPVPVPPFVFIDKGSLVSLSERSALGSLMENISKGSPVFVEGQVARIMYWGLHKQHQLALLGWKRTVLITLSELLDRSHRPPVKLH